MVLERLRQRIAGWIAPQPKRAVRAYAGARASRLTTGFGASGNSSADSELSASLTQLRARSRQLMRDAPYAKRARVIIVNNVVGAGVGLQAEVRTTRDELAERVNSGIEGAWRQWARAENCHTGGALAFADFERACLSEVVTAGEVFIRKHYRRFGASKVPLALELIEAERLADEFTFPSAAVRAEVRMGVEVDEFGRAVAYWMRERHPGEVRFTSDKSVRMVRVPADEILHLRVVDRWPQTRGEPWLHAVLRKLNDLEEYTGAELLAARLSANYFATIESPDADPLPAAETQDDGSKQVQIEPGVIEQLAPGDKLAFHTPNRPNTALDPFMRYMLREVAAGVGVSYESVSRDYSQSNYSSSRLSLLDDRDLWRVLQQWWVRSFREPLHGIWLQQAVLARAIESITVEQYAANPEKFRAVTWKLRGWTWVDPTKEVTAYKEAVKAGFTTVSAVIATTGGGVDIEDVVAERRRELDMFDTYDIKVDTTIGDAPRPAPAEPKDPDDEEAVRPARVVNLMR